MRTERTYAWPRFWFEAGAPVNTDNDGFLQDPTSKWAQYMPRRARPFEEIASIPCLVLLGEPGLGKTRALRSEHERLKAGGKKSLWLEFGRLGNTPEYLIQRLFSNPTFTRWQVEDGVLHLFLDALDEGLLEINNLHKILIDELREQTNSADRARLFLRLSCRTAQWPQSMGKELRELWGSDRYGEFRLAILREVDIQTAAAARGLDPVDFRAAVRKHEIEPLAARPITLEMLMAAYRDNHSFPKSKLALYEQGCRRLCDEETVGSDRQRAGKLSSLERLIIASRLAALSVFTNRNSFELVPNFESGERWIPLSEAEGGQESLEGNMLAVREPSIRETFELGGLFSGSSDGLITWAHKTYAEFLAARYLVAGRRLPVSKILSLLVHPDDPNHKIPSSLHETASWLASFRPEILGALLESNTEVLLYSDAASFNDATRSAILAQILDKITAGTFLPDLFETGRVWERLNHPGLKEQLRPFLTQKGTGTARFVAFRIASQCNCTALQQEILAVALDSGEKDEARSWAIETLELIGDPQARAGLRPLLTSTPPIAHRLLSHTLEALWPDQVSASEVFALLERVKTKEELTEYSGLFAHEPRMTPQGSEVTAALRWIQHSAYLAIHQVESFVEDIFLASLKAFDHPSVIVALAETILAISRQHLHLALKDCQQAYHADEEKRHQLLSALFDILSEQEEDIFWVFHYTFRLISSQDVGWLLEELAAEPSAGRRKLLARLIASNFDDGDEAQFAQVCETRNRFFELDEYLRWRLGPIELNSKLAEQFKNSYEFESARQKEEEERARREGNRPSPKDKIEELLHEAEVGNTDAWWRINLYLLEDERGHWHEMEGNLTISPGWIAAASETRAKLLAAAKLYLLQGNLLEAEFNYSSGTLYRRPMAGYRTLRLIQQEDLEFFRSLPPERWALWVPAVVYFLHVPGDDQAEARNDLFAVAYGIAKEAVHCEIRKALSAHMAQAPACIPSLLWPIKKVLDPPMAELLWEIFLGTAPSSGAAESIFRLLLWFGFPAALARAAECLREDSLADQQSWPNAIKVAVWLLTEAADHGWSLVGPAFQKNPEFGERLWKAVPAPREVPRLPLHALGETYPWLAEHFPSSEDPDSDAVFWLKNSLLQQIVNSGTLEACLLLDSLVRRFPGDESLRWRLQQAWEKFRQETFPWPSPKEFRSLIDNERVRLVRTEGELLDAVWESLERLQQDLQGKSPLVMNLWSELSYKEFKPHDEPHLSLNVEHHLNRDLKERGVIAHREVEIRRRRGGASGELLDILVSVREPITGEELNVIVEVKGSWNAGLLTDLSAQLVERYLRDFPGRSGIYLVGWFNCPQWTNSDSRKHASAKHDLESLIKQLNRQAAEVSSSSAVRVRPFVLNAALR